MADFSLANHGSIMILTALTEAAKEWAIDNLPDTAMSWGTDGAVVEPRYMHDIAKGIRKDGLTFVGDDS